jgi:SAM-dependent methyltransferase
LDERVGACAIPEGIVTFSKEWEDVFRANTHFSVWPWSDLVSYVSRYARPEQEFRRVLELGCGAGANIPFFVQRKMEYRAVEGSQFAVTSVRRTYPLLAEQIVCGDFTKDIPFPGPFDLVVDRVALPHNTTGAIRRTLAMIHNRLRPGGKFIGIDWFSSQHEDSTRGIEVDSHTRRDIDSRSLRGLGEVHFFDRGHLVDLFAAAGFYIERLEHKQSEIYVPSGEGRLAWWHFVAVKN